MIFPATCKAIVLPAGAGGAGGGARILSRGNAEKRLARELGSLGARERNALRKVRPRPRHGGGCGIGRFASRARRGSLGSSVCYGGPRFFGRRFSRWLFWAVCRWSLVISSCTVLGGLPT